ncbi:MAG: hypothetical protein GY756_14905 [bacterium]|nr:hypothetical protein [bacterium]
MENFEIQGLSRLFIKIKSSIRSYDPTFEHLIYGLKYTLPNLTGLILFLFMRRPFSSSIYFITSYVFAVTITKPTYKSKISDMFLVCIAIACGQFLICMLKGAHNGYLVIAIFILAFFIYATDKHRAVADVAPMWICVSLSVGYGWVNSVNQVIEMCIVFAIAVSYLYIFEYFASKLRIKATMIYIAELIYDSFYLFTNRHEKIKSNEIYNKHLLDKQFVSKADGLIENYFSNKKDKFFHKVTVAEHKASKVILNEEYHFLKNKKYATYFTPVYYIYRKLIRDITMLMEYRNQGDYSRYGTEQVINNIGTRLKRVVRAMKMEEVLPEPMNDNNLLDHWSNLVKKDLEDGKIEKTVGFSQFLYGLKCVLKDLDILEKLLSKKLPKY